MSNRCLSKVQAAVLRAADEIEKHPERWCAGERHDLDLYADRHCALGHIEIQYFGRELPVDCPSLGQLYDLIEKEIAHPEKIWRINDCANGVFDEMLASKHFEYAPGEYDAMRRKRIVNFLREQVALSLAKQPAEA